MNEKHFLFDAFLRRLPPLPKLPEEAHTLLTQADECLAFDQPELALQALAVLCQSGLGSSNGPIAQLELPPDMLLYFADCLDAVLTNANLESPPTHTQQGGSAAAAQSPSPTLLFILPESDPTLIAPFIKPAAEQALAASWSTHLLVTNEQAQRNPSLRLFQPAPRPTHQPIEPQLHPLDINITQLPPEGEFLEATTRALKLIEEIKPTHIIAIANLRTPITAALLHQRSAPIQINLAPAEPLALPSIDLIATTYTPPQPLITRARSRGTNITQWAELQPITNTLTRIQQAAPQLPPQPEPQTTQAA